MCIPQCIIFGNLEHTQSMIAYMILTEYSGNRPNNWLAGRHKTMTNFMSVANVGNRCRYKSSMPYWKLFCIFGTCSILIVWQVPWLSMSMLDLFNIHVHALKILLICVTCKWKIIDYEWRIWIQYSALVVCLLSYALRVFTCWTHNGQISPISSQIYPINWCLLTQIAYKMVMVPHDLKGF